MILTTGSRFVNGMGYAYAVGLIQPCGIDHVWF